MLEYDFIRNAFLAGTVIAVACGIMSYFVVVRRTAFAAHALGHISLTGATLAAILSLSPVTGLLVVNIISAVIMGLIGDEIKKNDFAVGIVLTFFLGLGAYFLYIYQTGYSGGIMGIMFGDVLSVSVKQIYLLLLLTVVVIVTLFMITKPLLFSSIDPVLAAAKRLPIRFLSILFYILLAITISMACQIVGALLIFALLMGPGVIASNLCDGFYSSIMTSVAIAVSTVWLSLVVSFYLDLPISCCITILVSIFYIFSTIKNRFFYS